MIFPKVVALLGIFLMLASVADSQMNRDTPFIASKLPRTGESNAIGQGTQPSSSIVISEPFNSQAVKDLSIAADPNNTTCNQASFIVTLTASPSGTTGYQAVKVRVLESRLSTPTAVAELTLIFPATGGSLHETIGFSSASDSAAGNRNSEITVTADPDNQLTETNERNNALIISGTCRD
jgi:hypothetical protein